jgi:hypothetical protein
MHTDEGGANTNSQINSSKKSKKSKLEKLVNRLAMDIPGSLGSPHDSKQAIRLLRSNSATPSRSGPVPSSTELQQCVVTPMRLGSPHSDTGSLPSASPSSDDEKELRNIKRQFAYAKRSLNDKKEVRFYYIM